MTARFWLIFILTFIAVLLIGVKVFLPKISTSKTSLYSDGTMRIGEVEVLVQIADEPQEMERGLSGRNSLPPDSGMLFVYPQAVTPRFWMKDMLFDLDFIWISDGKVVDMTQNVVAPVENPAQLDLYSPQYPITMMLEVPAGFVSEKNIKVGDPALLTLSQN